MKEQLITNLERIGKPTVSCPCPEGGMVLVLPHGGRVLGLFSPASNENLFWTHPALKGVESARAFYNGSDWQNSGGDRTWLSPEIDFFFPNYPSLDGYWQPRELDPGKYQVIQNSEGVHLVNRLTCTLSRMKATVDLEISKSISAAANPLRYERDADELANLAYVGYTQRTSLRIMEGHTQTPTPIGLWNLVQLPHDGELLVPTFCRNQPKVYFGQISEDDLSVTDRLVRYRMRAVGEHKIGMRAVATTGRVGYLRSSAADWTLVVRNFFVNPSGEYVDAPWTDAADLGYSVQACNIDSPLGSFSELEYHIPAIGQGTGRMSCDDGSQVWAYRGPRELILAAARILLSTDI